MPARLVAALLLAVAAPAIAQPAADLRLVEAIGWYTGTRGLVDDARARTLIEAAAFEGNVLARMWLARMYSRGRLGYPTDQGARPRHRRPARRRGAASGRGWHGRGHVPDGDRLRRGARRA